MKCSTFKKYSGGEKMPNGPATLIEQVTEIIKEIKDNQKKKEN